MCSLEEPKTNKEHEKRLRRFRISRPMILQFNGIFAVLAEREGFEPSIRLRVFRFSRPAYSTTLAPLHSKTLKILKSLPLGVKTGGLTLVSIFQKAAAIRYQIPAVIATMK
jgi:hypothetical protein